MSKLKYASVCSGIEAATVAWHPLGWRPVWFSQYDPENNYNKGLDFASEVLKHHYPEVPNLGDMTTILKNETTEQQWKEKLLTENLMCSLEEPPANHSQLPASEKEWMTSVVTSHLNLSAFLLQNSPVGSSGKMFRACLHQDQKKEVKEREKQMMNLMETQQTLHAFYQPGQGETLPPRNLKKGALSKVPRKRITPLHGAYLIAGISECHSGAGVSLLSDILEKTGDHLLRYCLSAKACKGILRRAEKRGKELPPILKHALQIISMGGGYRQRGFGDYVSDETASTIKKRDYKDATDLIIDTLSNETTHPCLTKQISEQSGQDLGQPGALVVGLVSEQNIPFTPSSFGNYIEGVGTLKKSGGDNGAGGSETLVVNIK